MDKAWHCNVETGGDMMPEVKMLSGRVGEMKAGLRMDRGTGAGRCPSVWEIKESKQKWLPVGLLLAM